MNPHPSKWKRRVLAPGPPGKLLFVLNIAVFHSWASRVTQTVKNPPAVWETWVQSLGWEDPLEKGTATQLQYACLENPMDRGAWVATVHGVAKSQTRLSGFHLTSTAKRTSSQRQSHNIKLGTVCTLGFGLSPSHPQRMPGVLSVSSHHVRSEMAAGRSPKQTL